MQLWVTLGLACVLACIALILVYFIGTALNFDDAKRIDKVPMQPPPPNDLNRDV
ncbi:MAG TPA: hypothetical protein VIG80_05485 [Bacillaceae bacterium]